MPQPHSLLKIKRITKKSELKKAYRLRYRYYCVKLKYLDKTNYPKKLEKDQFDKKKNKAIHFGMFFNSKIVGYCRLIPKKFPCESLVNLNQAIPGFNNRYRYQTLEISRLIVKNNALNLNMLPLIRAVYLYMKKNRLRYILGLSEDHLIEKLESMFGELEIIKRNILDCNVLNKVFFIDIVKRAREIKKRNPSLYKTLNNKLNDEAKRKMVISSLYKRNVPYIKKTQMAKLKDIKVLSLGCGLCSVILECAVRTGFRKFTLFDNDRIDLSNLNRQQYDINDLNKKKAKILENKLRKINPYVDIKANSKRIKNRPNYPFLEGHQLMIQTIDGSPAYVDVVDKALEMGITVFCPFNMGFGAAVMVFNKNTTNLSRFLDGDIPRNDMELFNLLLEKIPFDPPDYVKKMLSSLNTKNPSNLSFPQLSIGAMLTAALTCKQMLIEVFGIREPSNGYMPYIYTMDIIDMTIEHTN